MSSYTKGRGWGNDYQESVYKQEEQTEKISDKIEWDNKLV